MTYPTTLRRATLAIASTAVLAAGLLASTASMASAFDNRMGDFVQHIKDDPNYKRIPLETAGDREWFYSLTEKVYEHKITKEQFVAEGTKMYPGFDASFAEVADYMTMK